MEPPKELGNGWPSRSRKEPGMLSIAPTFSGESENPPSYPPEKETTDEPYAKSQLGHQIRHPLH